MNTGFVWSLSDRLTAVGFLITAIGGGFALWSRRRTRTDTRLERAPNVMVAIRRTRIPDALSRNAVQSERIELALENIGGSHAYDVECYCAPWRNKADASPHIYGEKTYFQLLKAGDTATISGTRALSADWNTAARQYDDLPYALFDYTITYADRTHQYTNGFLVSLFGYPDQLTGTDCDSFSMQLIRNDSIPLRRLQFARRLSVAWENLARPVWRWRYRRAARKHIRRQRDRQSN